MAKVHITLVGGQPTPVEQGVVLSKPDKIILICSSETEEIANTIKTKLRDLKYLNVLVERFPIENSDEIRKKILFLFSNYIGEQDIISMNLSSGVKIWSLLFLQLCKQNDAHIYCLSQNGEVLTIRGESPNEKVEFDMFTQFVLLGNPLEKYTCFTEFGETERQNAQTIKHLYQNSVFQKLLEKMKEQIRISSSNNRKAYTKHDQSVDLGNEQYIEWIANEKVFTISLNKKPEGYFELHGDHSIDMLLNTAWFEYEVASMLAEIYGAENVYMNCRFLSSYGSDKNEVDIIVNTGQKLLFVECKTKISKKTDIDKFASVVRNYGGDGSKAIFVTLEEMDITEKEKCKDNHVKPIHLQTNIIEQGRIKTYKNGRPQKKQLSVRELKIEIQSILTTANV